MWITVRARRLLEAECENSFKDSQNTIRLEYESLTNQIRDSFAQGRSISLRGTTAIRQSYIAARCRVVKAYPEKTSIESGCSSKTLKPAFICAMNVGISPFWNGSIALGKISMSI